MLGFLPAVEPIDRDGVVRWRFIEENYRVRATNEDILSAVAELRAARGGDA